jgi:hypothetical protein
VRRRKATTETRREEESTEEERYRARMRSFLVGFSEDRNLNRSML